MAYWRSGENKGLLYEKFWKLVNGFTKILLHFNTATWEECNKLGHIQICDVTYYGPVDQRPFFNSQSPFKVANQPISLHRRVIFKKFKSLQLPTRLTFRWQNLRRCISLDIFWIWMIIAKLLVDIAKMKCARLWAQYSRHQASEGWYRISRGQKSKFG